MYIAYERMSQTVEQISQSTGFPATTVAGVFTALRMVVARELRAGNEVDLPELGKFFPRDLGERDGRNPRTGEEIVISGKRYPKFRFSRGLGDEIQPIAPAQEQPQVTNSAPVVPAPPLPVPAPPLPVPPPPPVPAPSALVPPPPPPPVERTWFVATRDGTTSMPESDLIKMASPETQIYEPTTGWRQVKDVPELMKLLPPAY